MSWHNRPDGHDRPSGHDRSSWHDRSSDAVFDALDNDPGGLSSGEADRRLHTLGPNEIESDEGQSALGVPGFVGVAWYVRRSARRRRSQCHDRHNERRERRGFDP